MRSCYSVGVKLCIALGSICKESEQLFSICWRAYAFGGVLDGADEGAIYSASTSEFSQTREINQSLRPY